MMQYNWADRLRNLATFFVIAIHVSAPVAMDTGDYQSTWWHMGNFWNSLSRPGVPLFVMLSGFLLLGKDYPTGSFLKKRFSRVLIPSLFWMAVYSFYNYKANGAPDSFYAFFKGVFEGHVHYHLWFIYMILGLYLFYPVLRPWVRQARDADFFYIILVCMLASWGYKICYVFYDWHFGLQWEFYTNNLIYFVSGYYLGAKPIQSGTQNPLTKWDWSEKKILGLAVTCIVLGTVVTMAGAFYTKTNLSNPATHLYFYDYLTPNVGFAAAGWFLLARFAFEKFPLLEIEKQFSAASFGIYFMHVMVMDFLSEMGYWHSMRKSWLVPPALMVLIFLYTFLFVKTLRALPGGKRVT